MSSVLFLLFLTKRKRYAKIIFVGEYVRRNSATPTHPSRVCAEKFRHTHSSFAGMAELADAPDLGSGFARNAGSTPVTRTKKIDNLLSKIVDFLSKPTGLVCN